MAVSSGVASSAVRRGPSTTRRRPCGSVACAPLVTPEHTAMRNAKKRRFMTSCIGSSRPLQAREPSRTVALHVPLDPVQVEEAEQQVAGRHRLPLVVEVPVAFQLAAGAADEEVRDVVVLMLVRVAHVRPVQDQRLISPYRRIWVASSW